MRTRAKKEANSRKTGRLILCAYASTKEKSECSEGQ